MTNKFTAKEIHFLQTPDDLKLTPPETYFSDLLWNKTPEVISFEKRLLKTGEIKDHFLCAALQVSDDTLEIVLERARDAFEETFSALLDHGRGIWERLNETAFVLAFWDYENEDKAAELIVSLKQKLSAALKTDILVGAARFPWNDFSREETFSNALKAIDHAAFFGPDTLIHFDETSLNISADRLFHMQRYEAAILEYQKGLKLAPANINMLNSLGVAFGIMGELENAMTEFKKAMVIRPGELMVNYNIGLLYKIEDNIDKAILHLRKAHGIDEDVFEVALFLGQLLYQKELYDQAMPHLESATRINPKSGLGFRIKGEIFLVTRLPEKAAEAFNTAIKCNPTDAVSLSGYAKSLELQGKNLNIALTFAQNSVDLEPSNPLFKKRLENIRKKMGDPGPSADIPDGTSRGSSQDTSEGSPKGPTEEKIITAG